MKPTLAWKSADANPAMTLHSEWTELSPRVRRDSCESGGMGLLAKLADGSLGLEVTPPPIEITADDDDVVDLVDRDREIFWKLQFLPRVHLDLGEDHWDLLVRDAQRQSRALLASLRSGPVSFLDDDEWSPLVELAPFELPAGGRCLGVIHRTHLQPGFETVTAHTLVPTAHGLFDARWVTRTHEPGPRATTLGADEPARDAEFPDDPLSRARAMKAWCWRRIRVTEPPPSPARGPVLLPALGVTVTPPPRFQLARITDEGPFTSAYFRRASFSSFDGVDMLEVTRYANMRRGNVGAAAMLEQMARMRVRGWMPHAEGFTAELIEPERVTRWQEAVTAIAEGTTPGHPRGRLVWELAFDGDGALWSFLLSTTTAVPRSELLADVNAVRASVRA